MKTLFLISCILICGLALAQSPARLYVYSQQFTPGMIPDRNMNGQGSPTRNSTKYYVYFTQAKFAKIQFDFIRLDSQWYRINAIDSMGTPIYLKQPEKKLLMPQTNGMVLQLNIGEICPAPKGVSDLRKTGAHLIFKQKGKKYNLSLSKIKGLPQVQGL